jgi:predicted Zn-dependent protease
VTFAESAVNSAPRSGEARLALVRALLGTRDFGRAEQELAPLLKQFPNTSAVHSVNGSLQMLKSDLKGARASYDRALSLASGNLEAVAGLTALDMREKKAAQARERLDKRLAADPNSSELLILSAQVYTVQRDFANAESALRRAIQANPAVSRAYAMLAGVLVSAGKLEAARTEFDRLAQQNPKDIAAPTMSAMILQAQNKTAEAKKRYEAIVGENPTAAVASNNLAWIYAEEGDKLDDALRLAQSAAARMPDNPEVQDTIGWIYYKKELPALAVSAFEKSVEKSPENPLFLYHLALALDKAGDSKRARETVLRAVKVRPDYPEAQKLLAQLKG